MKVSVTHIHHQEGKTWYFKAQPSSTSGFLEIFVTDPWSASSTMLTHKAEEELRQYLNSRAQAKESLRAKNDSRLLGEDCPTLPLSPPESGECFFVCAYCASPEYVQRPMVPRRAPWGYQCERCKAFQPVNV